VLAEDAPALHERADELWALYGPSAP